MSNRETAASAKRRNGPLHSSASSGPTRSRRGRATGQREHGQCSRPFTLCVPLPSSLPCPRVAFALAGGGRQPAAAAAERRPQGQAQAHTHNTHTTTQHTGQRKQRNERQQGRRALCELARTRTHCAPALCHFSRSVRTFVVRLAADNLLTPFSRHDGMDGRSTIR